IVMDIGKSPITLGATYSGKDSDGNTVSGSHLSSNIYVITHRENGEKTTNTIVFDGHHENAPFNVTLDNVNMGATPKNHNQAPGNSGVNTPTGGQITIKALQSSIKKVTLVLKGVNQVRNITYYNAGDTSTPQTVDSYLKITDINGDGAAGDGVDGGSLYIPYKIETEAEIEAFVATKTNYNHWNAGIGGIDSQSLVQNLHIAGGKIQVVTTLGDNCTAIGAGGNGYCEMLISGGEVIAHCNGTGAAIGGGIGWNAAGGKSNVTITGGKVYAKNHSEIESGDELVGGVAIGSGSSFHAAGSEGIVTISGGYVEAYGTFGNGIGGGNSSTSVGGKATISITGGTVIASSIGGGDSKSGVGGSATVVVSGTADITLTKGIGGGKSSSGNGGAATITVESGTMNVAGSIGGGEGGGTGNGGDATVNIYGGNLTAASIGGGTGSVGGHGGAAIVEVTDGFIETGSIGGGKTNNPNGNLGYAKATISGGDISGQFLMAAGGTEPCTFTMTGGTLHGVDTADTSKFNYAQQNGAAVYMDDPNGVVSISGGTIKDCSAVNGGAIYMSDGTCTISGNAVIESCVASENGGAVYMGGGTLTITGGSIKNNSAEQNGGAVYLGGGSMTVYSGEISANTAKDSGGAAFIDGGNVKVAGGSITNNTATKDGGGIVVNNGNYKMTGGSVDNNTAVNGAGGGIYVSTDGHNVTVDVLSGSVSNNTAKGNGGAFAVVGNTDSTESIIVNVGVNKNHFDTSGNLITNCEHGDEGDNAYACPVLNGNKSGASGGGIYVTGNTSTQLNIYCLEEKDSQADGDNGQSNFMKVDGGKVTITTSEQLDESNQTSYHGNTHITSEVYVTGGQMDLWGGMTNPRLEDIITVDITKKDDHFLDHRDNTTEDKYYKLIYFENFTDPVTNITTGQYKEIEIKHGNSINISGNIYSHPGYTIKGWNTSNGRDSELDNYPQGTYNNDRGWYNVGDEKTFDGVPIGDLTIYAIWEANGYTVVYEPNVPSGETCYGTMENFNFTYDTPIKLSKNQYERPGYEFIGWSKEKEPDSSAKIYADEEVVTNLTTKKGEIVTLYAQWKVCDHDPATHEYTYSVIDNGKTLKRDCSCGKYSEEARLSAEDAVYDENNHEGKVVYTSSKWNPVVVYEALDGDVFVDDKPYYAGSYKASITENGYTASVTYTIEKADQPAPPKPDYDTNTETDGSVISVKPVVQSSVSDKTDTPYSEYRIVYYVDGVEKATVWVKGADELIDGQYAARFALDKALTNYHIQVRYSESDNYKESPVSTADSIYFFVGEVEFKVICGEGVKYVILTSSEDDVTENGIKIAVSVEDGYFFPRCNHPTWSSRMW
ncbi:MAG: right-handed parallel beta-helix repeat-containing protein, partial [Clostridia bacterium]|nr:right-handed parallel beta-helix repeat-containing protein [Clostridia bacterium]